MNKKKILLAVLALILVCSISVAGTLAYMQAQQDTPVVNTFVAAGGGQIINPTRPTPPPSIPEGLNPNFYLVESEAVYNASTAQYTTGSQKVTANRYDKVVPGMIIPKDPTITVDINDGVDAYVFIKVEDTNAANLIDYSVNSDNWTAISTGSNIYYYKDIIVNGISSVELSNVAILTDNKVSVSNTATDFSGLRSLSFSAYVCQAGGFTSAADAYDKCFNQSNSGT